ncbi:unnamed protein product [Malus baccata var. baccata]
MKFSYCLPRRIGDEAALHFSIDVELRHHAHVQTIPILGSDIDFYYVNMTGISVAGSVLPIDLGCSVMTAWELPLIWGRRRLCSLAQCIRS